MKWTFFIIFLLLTSKISFSQEHSIHPVKYIFDPNANAKRELDSVIAVAGKEHKRILVLVGGDWSVNCMDFNEMLRKVYLQKILQDSYVFLRINFSPGNKNEEALKQIDCPRYDGYPQLVVLDETGKKIHAQGVEEFKIDVHLYFGPKMEKWLGIWASPDASAKKK